MIRLIEMFEKIILKLIDKMNIAFVMLILVLLGIMNKEEVFEWIKVIGKSLPSIGS